MTFDRSVARDKKKTKEESAYITRHLLSCPRVGRPPKNPPDYPVGFKRKPSMTELYGELARRF